MFVPTLLEPVMIFGLQLKGFREVTTPGAACGQRMDFFLNPAVCCSYMGNLCLFTARRPLSVVSQAYMLQAVPSLWWIEALQHSSNLSSPILSVLG